MSTIAQRRLDPGPAGDALFVVLVVVDFVFLLALPAGLAEAHRCITAISHSPPDDFLSPSQLAVTPTTP